MKQYCSANIIQKCAICKVIWPYFTMFTFWRHWRKTLVFKTRICPYSAVSTTAPRQTCCFLSPWGQSVHGRLENDSTQSIGWFSFQACFSLSSSLLQIPRGVFHRHRAQCVPVQTLRGTAWRLPGPLWARTQYWNWHRKWQHIIPLPQSESWPGTLE